VGDEVERYAAWRTGLAVTPVITSLRELAEAVRQGEVAKVERGDDISDEERERLDAVTRAVLNKLLHEPTVRAREAASSQEGLRHIDSLRYLFGLDLPDRPPVEADAESAEHARRPG